MVEREQFNIFEHVQALPGFPIVQMRDWLSGDLRELVTKSKCPMFMRSINFIFWVSVHFFSLNRIVKNITPNFLIFFICL